MSALSRQIPAGEDWITRELAALRREMREQIAAATAGLVDTVHRVAQTTQVLTATRTTPVSGPSAEWVATGPDWATHALCVSGATLSATTLNGAAQVRLTHDSVADRAPTDDHESLDLRVGAAAAAFVVQGQPCVVALRPDRTLYTRPWGVGLGATAGTTSITFTTVVTWIAT